MVFDHSLGSYGKCKHFAKHLKCILGVGVQGQESPSTSEVTIQETLGNMVHVSGEKLGKKVLEFWQTPWVG